MKTDSLTILQFISQAYTPANKITAGYTRDRFKFKAMINGELKKAIYTNLPHPFTNNVALLIFWYVKAWMH